MVVHAFNPNIQETEADLWEFKAGLVYWSKYQIQSQPGLHNETLLKIKTKNPPSNMRSLSVSPPSLTHFSTTCINHST